MKEKIKHDIMTWYNNQEHHEDHTLEDLIDLVMEKTTESLIEEIKKQLKDEFINGNLKHDFIISPDYYLELKLKEIEQNFTKSWELHSAKLAEDD